MSGKRKYFTEKSSLFQRDEIEGFFFVILMLES